MTYTHSTVILNVFTFPSSGPAGDRPERPRLGIPARRTPWGRRLWTQPGGAPLGRRWPPTPRHRVRTPTGRSPRRPLAPCSAGHEHHKEPAGVYLGGRGFLGCPSAICFIPVLIILLTIIIVITVLFISISSFLFSHLSLLLISSRHQLHLFSLLTH